MSAAGNRVENNGPVSGQALRAFRELQNILKKPYKDVCNVCNGEGKITNKSTCPKCKGSGQRLLKLL